MLKRLYSIYLRPFSRSEDGKRREFILNILLFGILTLSGAAILSAVVSRAVLAQAYNGPPPILLIIIWLVFLGLYVLSRQGYYRIAAYLFLLLLFVFNTYPVAVWGILLPQGILTYSLIIVMAGVLINSQAAFRVTLLIFATLLLIIHLESVGAIHFNTNWLQQKGGYNDVIVYGFTYGVIALVAWLSNREIERSLTRARQSERALRQERNSLEVKVQQRTKELEHAQVEKLQELSHFAEFGRVSSTLLHELANPLTSAMLNLDQLESRQKSTLVRQIRESIAYMERYVDNARRHLRNQSESVPFTIADEINRVMGFIEPKAKASHVRIESTLQKNLHLVGDSIKFDQVISNLLVNAIDATADLPHKRRKSIRVTTQREGTMAEIVVQDFGVGISKQELGHVFEPFYTTKTAERGTGLGLTITRRTIEEDFAGTIEATSDRQHGTRFVIRLPLS